MPVRLSEQSPKARLQKRWRKRGREIEDRDPTELVPHPRHPRTHSSEQIGQIETSIQYFDFLGPVLIDGQDRIIAGHGRVQAAINLGIPAIPTVRITHLTATQVRAYVIADNKIAENAGWDNELLALELKEISGVPDFDFTSIGFESAEIDQILDEFEGDVPDRIEEVAGTDRSKPAVSRIGDLWHVNNRHALICGNALEANTYRALLGSELAAMAIIDAPYNVPIAGHASGLGKVKHHDFVMACGRMSKTEFTRFLATAFQHVKGYSRDGSISFAFMDWRHMGEVLAAGKEIGELKNLCIWAKNNAGMGSLYRSQHELVFVYKSGNGPHVNNVKLGRFGRNRSNLWSYPGATSFGKDRDADLAMHPTVKPVAMLADAILDCSTRGSIVLDPFAGSGSTLIAAEKTGRRGYGIELDPYYVDTIIRRFARMYGLKATLAQSGKDFDTVGRERHATVENCNVTKKTVQKEDSRKGSKAGRNS